MPLTPGTRLGNYGVVARIDALKASIPKGTLDGLVANASTLSPAAVLAIVASGGQP